MLTCLKCGLDCTNSPGAISRLCEACLNEARTKAQKEYGALMDARRDKGIDTVNKTELRESGWHNEVVPGLSNADQWREEVDVHAIMRDELGYER